MKILFTAGGTAGHVNPAIAAANYIMARHPNAQILFAGNPTGMEARLVKNAGFAFAPIHVLGIQRQLTWKNFKNNVKAVGYLTTCSHRAKQILKDFQPDLVMGTGGYVSGPILRKAAQMGFKTMTHEQNAFPGVTTRLLSKYVDKILLAVPDAQKYLSDRCEYVVTGNPVREEIIFADKEKSREELHVGQKPCILSFGGSLGAKRLNEAIADLIAWHYKDQKIFHIHATGHYGVTYLPELLYAKKVDVSQNPGIIIREYIDDMPRCLAAADIVISRAGAISISEIEVASKASILIPSPNVAENHQYYNALALSSRGGAVLIEEKDLTGDRLIQAVQDLLDHPQKLKEISQKAGECAIADANQRIYEEMMKMLR